MESADFIRTVQISLDRTEQNKVLYGNDDQRLNLNELESANLENAFIAAIREQAKSIACLIKINYLVEKDQGWQFHPNTPTLAQRIKKKFKGIHFGRQEAFRNQLAPGFGTAYLVDKRIAITPAHCVCKNGSNILDIARIEQTRLVFGFNEIKANPADYFFDKQQVYQIKTVIAHSYIKKLDKDGNYTEWTDWALLELNEEVPIPPLRMNMTEKVADKIELYMLGHPSGLPLKYAGNGYVLGNTNKDFFECNLDAFGGNSGSFVAAKSTQIGCGILCSGKADYKSTDNYKGTGKKRIQAHCIIEQENKHHRVGERYENCQRVDILRFLVNSEFLGINKEEGLAKLSTPEAIVKSLQKNYQNRNTIPRILHHPLPIEEAFMEPVVLELDKKEGQATFQDQNSEKTAKRSLIIGGAGIGKSIYCQYLAYKWAHGTFGEKFDALFWVPLRKLQQINRLDTTAKFLFRLCCQEHGPSLYWNDIADYLQQNKDRILFVLDGLDEVALDEGSLQKQIVDELLAFPHWILTSRPHAAASIQADVTLENVGIASHTIDDYIRKSCPKNSQNIIQKIRENPTIFGLCHIPLNLELVCSILQNSEEDISFTMTSLYEELTLLLQRRFADQLGRKDAWHWSSEDIAIDFEIGPIFKSLELIAWEGMRENIFSFSFQHGEMEKIYNNSFTSSQAKKREPLFKNMCESGFLQSTGDNIKFLDNEYSFLHLTFQEFFAARYLLGLLKEHPEEAKKCMQEIKFNPRYKIVMWFAAGLLRNEKGSCPLLNAFFDMLDTPKDSIGFYGALLKIRCLEECVGWQKKIHKLKDYEQEIQMWIEKSFQTGYNTNITMHLVQTFEISPQSAQLLFIPKLLSCLSNDKRDAAIKILGDIGHADLEAVLPPLIEAFKDERDWIKKIAVAKALGQVGHANPKTVVPLLIEALKDENVFSREAVLTALNQISQANPKAVITEVIEAFKKSKNADDKKVTVEALGQVGQTNLKAILPLLNETLDDEDTYVRCNTAKALGLAGQADPEAVLYPLIKALKDKHKYVRHTAAEALGQLGQDGLIAVLPELINARDDEEDFTRSKVIEALGQAGQAAPNTVLPSLIRALKDENSNVQLAAAKAICQLGQADLMPFLPELIETFKDNYLISESVAKTLGQFGQAHPKIVLPLLIVTLKDNNKCVRIAVVKALGEIGQTNPMAVLHLLIEALKDKDYEVRTAAAEALSLMDRADPETVLFALIEALNDIKAIHKIDGLNSFRNAALKVLGQVGQANLKAVLPSLIEIGEDEDHDVNFHVKDELIKAFGQLGKTNPNIILPLLIKMYKENHFRLSQREYLNQLFLIKPEAAIPELVKSIVNEKHVSITEAEIIIGNYDLSPYLKSHSFIINYLYEMKKDSNFLFSTPLSSLIFCCKKNPTECANFITAITIKCIEENLAIFQTDDIVSFYEHGKICKINFPGASEFLLQIGKLGTQYPQFT